MNQPQIHAQSRSKRRRSICRPTATPITAAHGTSRSPAATSRRSIPAPVNRSARWPIAARPTSRPRSPPPRRLSRPGATCRRSSARGCSAHRQGAARECRGAGDDRRRRLRQSLCRDGQATPIAAAQLEFYAGLVTEMKGASIPMGPDVVNFSVREPRGVVGRIIPFNHPFMFCAGKSAAPLAAGNTVVIKPPEQAPLSSLRLAELIDGILPPGVFNVVPGGTRGGPALASHPDVAMIALIGSVPTGRAVMKAAVRHAQAGDARARRQERADRLSRTPIPTRSRTASSAA